MFSQAAFIAGVQAQVISFTLALERNTMGKNTNIIAFVGLSLDIIGTYMGLMHISMLRSRIRRNTVDLDAMTRSLRAFQNNTSRDEKTPYQLRGADDPERAQLPPDHHLPENEVRELEKLYEDLDDRFTNREGRIADYYGRVTFTPLEFLRAFLRLGRIPAAALEFGLVALGVSIIMFASASTTLPSAVWVSCVAVVGAVVVLSIAQGILASQL